jgi:membrane protein required for colicin V production
MNGLDIALITLLSFFILKGLYRGFAREIITIIGLIVAFPLAALYYPDVAKYLRPSFENPVTLDVISFLFLFVVIYIIIAILGIFLDKLANIRIIKPLNIFFGGIIGIIKGMFIASLLLLALTAFLKPDAPLLSKSVIHPYIGHISDIMLELVPEDLKKNFKDKRGNLNLGKPGLVKETIEVIMPASKSKNE